MRTKAPLIRPMPYTPLPQHASKDLALLRPGDMIEARQWDTVCHRGEVDIVVPGLGLLWLLEEPLKNRRLIEAQDYSIRKVQSSTTRR